MTINTFVRMLATGMTLVMLSYLFIAPNSVDLLAVPIWLSIGTLLITTIIDIITG